ncbi:MAG: hypothetical protein IIC07_04485 [Proteobacteria bacterium]|nr:hypothetical protein [Pseudomonadota bacterium]
MVSWTILDSPGSVSEQTYTIRVGQQGGKWYIGRIEVVKLNGEMAKFRGVLQEIIA